MTRKDFVIIAELLGKIDGDAVDAKRDDVNAVLRTTNANFDAVRFWQAVENNR